MSLRSDYWTNPSVLTLGADSDPTKKIQEIARSVVLSAAEQGWDGPPFDPFELAGILKVRVRPNDDILDARTTPLGSEDVQIEFNPNRPRGRTRFSVAHELVHTLFPDCSDTVRNRTQFGETRGDEWQLELLCNIGAAELLMPTDFVSLESEPIVIENLLRLRKEFDVSTEALLRRVTKATSSSCVMFAASRASLPEDEPIYRIDYSVPSRSWSLNIGPGHEVRTKTVISECTAIGYTAKGNEQWDSILPRINVECVGVPPYPNHRFPRVLGILTPETGSDDDDALQIHDLIGDATEPRGSGRRLIAHVVNDRTPNWGGGFARELRRKWGSVQDDFREWAQLPVNNLSLGNIHVSDVSKNLGIVSLIAQHGYGPSANPRIRYAALSECLQKLSETASQLGASVHMPRIGSGQAGGNWGLIRDLIDEALPLRGVEVTVYSLPDQVPREVQTVLHI